MTSSSSNTLKVLHTIAVIALVIAVIWVAALSDATEARYEKLAQVASEQALQIDNMSQAYDALAEQNQILLEACILVNEPAE